MLAIQRLLFLSSVLGLAVETAAQNTSLTAILDNLEHYWSYGRSPPVYPSPVGTGSGDWAAAYSQARALVAQMTNEEKENMTYGYTSLTNGCSGTSGPVLRLGFPGLCLNDAGNGVRGTDGVNGYPSGVHVGAAWNKYQRPCSHG